MSNAKRVHQNIYKIVDGIELYAVPGYEAEYSVSKCGKVRSHSRNTIRKNGRPYTRRGRWLSLPKGAGGYKLVTVTENKKRYVHHLVMLTFCGPTPAGCEIDHINRDKGDNRIENLRWATRHSNSYNSSKMKRPTSSKYRGVCWNKRLNAWLPQITCGGKGHYIGYFQTEVEAARAYDKKAKELFGDYASLNFPY